MTDLPPEPAAYVEIVTRAAACGLPRARLSITYAEDLQNEELLIQSADLAIDDATMRCLVDLSLATGVDITFDPPELSGRYASALQDRPQVRAGVGQMREDARNELRREGLLDRLPIYSPADETLADFAVRLDAGFSPGSVLHVTGDHLEVRASEPARLDYQRLMLLNRAFAAQPHDLPVALIGVSAP